jgi:hypothetical protein
VALHARAAFLRRARDIPGIGGNGSRAGSNEGVGAVFAEEYPRFMEVSELVPKPERMNERYEALFESNRDIFDGARVLDLASHDGRYSFAALKAGAVHVTGVEVR